MARLDVELVVYVDQRLNVAALRQRMAAGARRTPDRARVQPTSLVIFDVLWQRGSGRDRAAVGPRRTLIEDLHPSPTASRKATTP